MSGTTVVKRDKGIPGSNTKKQIIDMGGPVPQQRSSLTNEQLALVQNRTPQIQEVKDIESEEELEETSSGRQFEDDGEKHEEGEVPAVKTYDLPLTLSRQEAKENAQPLPVLLPSRRTREYSSTPAPVSQTREMRPAPTYQQRKTTTPPGLVRSADMRDARPTRSQPKQALPKKRKQHHPVLWIGLTLTVVLFFAIVVLPWLTDRYNDLRYRDPRIDYTYAVLGTNDNPEHKSFITTINKGGQVVITLYPGKGQAPIAYVLQPVATSGADHIPATIEIIPGKTSTTKYIAIHYNGSTLILSYEANTLKRIM